LVWSFVGVFGQEKVQVVITQKILLMCARIVADSSVFILGKRLEGDLITVPAVELELKDLRSKSHLDISGASIEGPSAESLRKAKKAAQETGDITVLSEADLEVLAKALEYEAILATDDYAIQNVAFYLGLKVMPVAQPVIRRKMRRVQKCVGCGENFEGKICPDCGTSARRKDRRIR
jgi:UPF0271 protein